MKKLLLSAIVLFTSVVGVNAQLIKRDFLEGYTVGGGLEKGAYTATSGVPILLNQWNLSGKTGTSDQGGENAKVVSALTYAGYVDSGKDVAVELLKLSTGGRTAIYSLADDNTYGAGTYYFAFVFNVTAASISSSSEFFSLDGNFTGNAQRVRFSVKGIESTTTYQIGLGDSGAATTLTGTYNYGQTYLAVIKVELDGEGTGTSSLYINPNLESTEPATAIATSAITGTALKSIRGVVVRQRSTIAAQIGGIRFAGTWANVLGQVSTSIEQNSFDKGNIVSSEYYNLNGVKVNEPAENSGICIQKNIYDSGLTEFVKVIR